MRGALIRGLGVRTAGAPYVVRILLLTPFLIFLNANFSKLFEVVRSS